MYPTFDRWDLLPLLLRYEQGEPYYLCLERFSEHGETAHLAIINGYLVTTTRMQMSRQELASFIIEQQQKLLACPHLSGITVIPWYLADRGQVLIAQHPRDRTWEISLNLVDLASHSSPIDLWQRSPELTVRADGFPKRFLAQMVLLRPWALLRMMDDAAARKVTQVHLTIPSFQTVQSCHRISLARIDHHPLIITAPYANIYTEKHGTATAELLRWDELSAWQEAHPPSPIESLFTWKGAASTWFGSDQIVNVFSGAAAPAERPYLAECTFFQLLPGGTGFIVTRAGSIQPLHSTLKEIIESPMEFVMASLLDERMIDRPWE
jgi:hypothetical protein